MNSSLFFNNLRLSVIDSYAMVKVVLNRFAVTM